MAWSTISRHARGYGRDWDKVRQVILKRDCYLCQQCKREGMIKVANIVDHIISKATRGTDDESNLEVICKQHHDKKTIEETGKTYRAKVSIGLDGWPK